MKDPGGSRCCPIFGERTDSKAQIIVNCVLIHIITKRTQEFIIRRKFLPVKDSQLLYDIRDIALFDTCPTRVSRFKIGLWATTWFQPAVGASRIVYLLQGPSGKVP